MECVAARSMVAILAMALVLTMGGEASYSNYAEEWWDHDSPTQMLHSNIAISSPSPSPSPSPMPIFIAPVPAPVVSPPKVKKPHPKGHKSHPRHPRKPHSHGPHSHGPPRYGPPRTFGAKSGMGTYQYWQSNPSEIPKVFMSEMATIDKIFGSSSLPKYGYKLTVMDALANKNSNMQNEYTSLAQQAVTSLLNAYTIENFVYTPEEVHELFNDALVSPDTAYKQALEFEQVNLLV